MTEPLRLRIVAIDCYERAVDLRLPFRFGVVTLTHAPQAFVRARIRLADGREAVGGAAEMLAPKWFDKNLALTNEDNFRQLRTSLALARDAYLAAGEDTAFAHFAARYAPQLAAGARVGLNALIACYGPALIDRAVLDALCRARGVSFAAAIRGNLAGIAGAPLAPDLAGFDLPGFLRSLAPGATIAARHTVGLADPLTAGDQTDRIGDGLPETLAEVVSRYRHRYYKLKVSGDLDADLVRLEAIAAVLDASGEPYRTTLDGNEQYVSVDGVVALWRRILEVPRLRRLAASVLFVEQPIVRTHALTTSVRALAELVDVIIDESDETLDAFPRARALGYSGVSSKTCKGLYKSLLNAARCARWRAAGEHAFLSGEDLSVQPGLALQQDLALVSLLGLVHVERNGHHYVNGMTGLPAAEQAAFLAAHPDLYERSHGAVRVAIRGGEMAIASLDCVGYASGALPAWETLQPMDFRGEPR